MTNFIYPEIGEAAIALLKSLGCTIVIPKNQHCCGFPALSGGIGHLPGTCGRNLAHWKAPADTS
jgi:glycolate oxidase iron-sulfur subunit